MKLWNGVTKYVGQDPEFERELHLEKRFSLENAIKVFSNYYDSHSTLEQQSIKAKQMDAKESVRENKESTKRIS